MNLFIPDSALGMQRCRHWTPLLTQQLRLRHLYQIMVYNVTSRSGGSFYYTLHLTTMCAPFYTSEKNNSYNPKWKELDTDNFLYPSLSAFVIRIWQTQENDVDVVIVTWVINLSGLVYLGVKLSEIQPDSFNENSVILHLRGGYFASYISLRTDLQKPLQFIDNLNVSSDEFKTKVFRCTSLKVIKNEMKPSYNVSKLQKLHLLQLNIKNQSLDVQKLRDNIISKCGLCNADEVKRSASCNEVPRRQHSSQLLTMTTLNKMLQWQEKPTIEQRQRIINVCKQIEIAKFRTRLLSQERDKQSAHLRQLKVNYSTLVDENEERGYLLMENYRILSRDSDKLKEWCSKQIQLKEIFLQTYAQLHHRRQQLMSQLLIMYPIEQVTPRKSLIGGIYLPDSDMLSDCSDGGLAVALGYTSHILLMCASFVQVPLRYNITFFGSRSYITDHINTALLDRDRDFPLYTKGKDKMQFNYAVYLLNKNIAQLRWLCGQHTPDLRATLPNLQSFLQGRGNKDHALAALPTNKTKTPNHVYKSVDFISQFEKPFLGSSSNISDPILDTLRQENQERTMSPINRRKKNDGPRPGLSEILAIPEAFLTQQISTNAFKTFATTEKFKLLSQEGRGDSDSKASSSKSASEASCSHPTSSNRNDVDNIEQGTDILHSSMNKTDVNSIDVNVKAVILEERPRKDHADKLLKQNRRISRSVGSITEEENFDLHSSLELGSDPLINVSAESNKSFNSRPLNSRLDDGQQEFLQKWLDSGPALVCSEENLYPDEILGSTIGISNSSSSPLTTRTDALLNTTSFNLIKPK
ncbi:hypothetical protein RN001_015212 [Aquatica leii]|uniref:UV radiation resistance-associated gene protein n=1 Tax=Aquatica leii TaxID=1421715 RepID=A0AAN7QCE5_9COLE|nr:hypothetical protein RN001_015212 [Aquatica leii]